MSGDSNRSGSRRQVLNGSVDSGELIIDDGSPASSRSSSQNLTPVLRPRRSIVYKEDVEDVEIDIGTEEEYAWRTKRSKGSSGSVAGKSSGRSGSDRSDRSRESAVSRSKNGTSKGSRPSPSASCASAAAAAGLVWTLNKEMEYYQLGQPSPEDYLYTVRVILVSVHHLGSFVVRQSKKLSKLEWRIIFEAFGTIINSDVFTNAEDHCGIDESECEPMLLGDAITARIRANEGEFSRFLAHGVLEMKILTLKDAKAELQGRAFIELEGLREKEELRSVADFFPENQGNVPLSHVPKLTTIVNLKKNQNFSTQNNSDSGESDLAGDTHPKHRQTAGIPSGSDSIFVTPKRSTRRRSQFSEASTIQSSASSRNSSHILTPVLRPRRPVERTEEMETDAPDDNWQAAVTIRNSPRQSEQSEEPPASETVEDGIFQVLLQGAEKLEDVCSRCVEKFEGDNDKALVEILQFIIRSAGCTGILTPAAMKKPADALLEGFMEELDEEEDDSYYPLIRPGKRWKGFHQRFCDFFFQWASKIGRMFWADHYESFWERFSPLVLAMADHKVRNYRHTATVAVIKMMSGFVTKQASLSLQIRDKKRQLKAEQKKGSNARDEDRIEALHATLESLEKDLEEFKTLFVFYYRSVFSLRFRDTNAEIRLFCISALGAWMKTFPQEYMQDEYLKVMNVSLSDPNDQIRAVCLECLLPLYMDEDVADRLKLFTTQCKNLLMAMAVDKNEDVAQKALRLITAISKYKKGHKVLTTYDHEKIYGLVYAKNRACAVVAAGFLSERLFDTHSGATFDSPKKTGSGKSRRPNTPILLDLLDFFIESEMPGHAAYLVDSLIEIHPLVKDWATMTELLLEDPGPDEQPLSEQQETSLINIMTCAVKQAATGVPPEGREASGKMNGRSIKQVSTNKVNVTHHFLENLPQLLEKYQIDGKQVATLLTIPLYFDLKLCNSSRQRNSLESLLEKIKEIVEHHSSSEVVEATAKALEILCLDEKYTSGTTDARLLQVLEDLPANVANSCRRFEENIKSNQSNDEAVESLCADLQKLAHFSSSFDLNTFHGWEVIFKMVRLACSGRRSYPVKAVKDAISACYFFLLWSLKSIKESEDSEEDHDGLLNKINVLKTRIRSFLIPLRILLAPDSPQELKEPAFTAICDTLTVFCQKDGDEFWKAELTCPADKVLTKLMIQFLMDTIFQSENDPNEDTLARNVMNVTLFCKLLIFKVLESEDVADVFKYYLQFFDQYGGVFKTALDYIRKTDQIIFSDLIIKALVKFYIDVKPSEDFLPVYNLARRFSLLFGVNANNYQPALIALHRNGIQFAANNTIHRLHAGQLVPPTNLTFLDVLTEFSGKVTPDNKHTIYQFLNQHFDVAISASTPGEGFPWSSLFGYRVSLGFDSNATPSQHNAGGATPIPGARARRAAARSGRRVKRFASPTE